MCIHSGCYLHLLPWLHVINARFCLAALNQPWGIHTCSNIIVASLGKKCSKIMYMWSHLTAYPSGDHKFFCFNISKDDKWLVCAGTWMLSFFFSLLLPFQSQDFFCPQRLQNDPYSKAAIWISDCILTCMKNKGKKNPNTYIGKYWELLKTKQQNKMNNQKTNDNKLKPKQTSPPHQNKTKQAHKPSTDISLHLNQQKITVLSFPMFLSSRACHQTYFWHQE